MLRLSPVLCVGLCVASGHALAPGGLASAQDITTDLEAHWAFDETSGSSAADSSGNGLTGSVSGASWATDGRVGGCLEFDGSNDYVSVSNSSPLQISGDITIAAWVRADSVSGNHCIVGHGPSGSATQYTYLYAWLGDWLGGSHSSGTDRYAADTVPAIDVGEWTHVAVVHNGSQWRLYRNGELFATNTTSQGAINTASGLWAIGSPSGLANRFFDGQIDEVRVYSRALSDADIDMLYLDGWATKRLLMIVTDADSPSSEELDRKAEFEGWGYAVYLITSTDSQSEYDDALVGMDVAYVPEDIASGDVASKLREATIGVVSEEPFLDDDLGFSDSDGSSKSGTDLDIVDDTHPITSGFSLGTLTILSTAERLVRIEGTTATGGSVLAEADSSPGLMVVETGAALANSYNGSSVAFGRRVRLPIGGNDFVWAYLNSDGLQLFRNALDWASSGPSTSLVAHWDFDEGTGTTVADESGNGNDASFDAGTPAWTTGVRGYALQFDGSSDVETDANFDPPAVGSVSFWLRAAATPTGNERLFGVANSWEARTDATGAVYFDLHAGAGGIFSTPAGVLSPGRWRHVVAVYDSVDDTYSAYVDGEFVGAGSVTLDDKDGSSRLSFGTRNGSTERFNGALDDVRVYSVELTLAEVQELYGLLAHYTLDETSGTTVADSSGLGNDATHVDGPTVGASAVRSNGATYNGADSNDRTDLPHDLLDEKSAYSLAWWVRSQGAGVQAILSGANSGQSNAALIVFSDDDTLECQVDGSANFYSVDTIANDHWQHFVYQHDRITGVEKVYVNGQLVGSTTRTGTTNLFDIDDGGLMLAQEQDSVGGGFNTSQALYGSLDDVRIYDRMLDDAEVAEIYGLVGHWKLDEASGTTAADSSGYGVDLTAVGSPAFASGGVRDGASEHDSYDYFQSADGAYASSITEAVSFACWFRLDDSVQDLTDRPWLVEFTGTTGGELWVSTNSDDLRFQVFAASGVAEKAHGDDLDLAPGSWHQAVGVYDGAEARIYLDGQLYTTLTDTDGIAPPTGQLRIGRNLIGGMDDVMVYNRVMTDAEIAEHYGLIGHWKFDESSGTTIADATLMGNDATFYTGDPAWGSGQVDGAIEFDGGDDAQTDNVFDPPATGTVAFWFRPQNSFTTSERLLGLGDDWEVRADSYGYLVFDLGATAVYEFETDDYASSAASWHHIVAMFDADADTYELYGDGTLLTSGSLSIAKQAAGYLSFGTTTGSTERFSGALDDVRVYNRWISAEEISALSGGTTSSGLRIMQWVEVR